jgi:hypothetical protein
MHGWIDELEVSGWIDETPNEPCTRYSVNVNAAPRDPECAARPMSATPTASAPDR